ncbi:hypothetical protein SDC9_29903 [bioreactor metagenome]|uniref:Uncharacterized protein n=1 Tax=bioreactor metagenome TaxID=1076179 RepID=A0A644UYD3_9ZZZZ
MAFKIANKFKLKIIIAFKRPKIRELKLKWESKKSKNIIKLFQTFLGKELKYIKI